MPQDAFTLSRLVRALDAALRGGKVNKIVQPRADRVELTVYASGRTRRLALSANAARPHISFTSAPTEAPLVCPNFCMLLRKHLSGAEIVGAETVPFERIVRLTFVRRSELLVPEEKVLIAELMGKYSNLFLTEHGKVLGALRPSSLEDSAVRPLIAGMPYRLPPAQDKADPTDAALAARLAAFPGGNFARFAASSVRGIAGSTAEALAAELGVPSDAPPFDEARAAEAAARVRAFLLEKSDRPCVLFLGDSPADFFAFPYPAQGGAYRFYPSLTEAAETFYDGKDRAEEIAREARRLLAAVQAYGKKQQKKLGFALERKKDAEGAEEDRRTGDFLTANLYRVKKGDGAVTAVDYESGEERTVALDPRLSPSENAARFYRRYAKRKKTLEAVAPQIAEAESELAYADELAAEIGLAETAEDLREIARELADAGIFGADKTQSGASGKGAGKRGAGKNGSAEKKGAAPARERVYEAEGFLIRAGRNNLQNDRLTGRAKPEWLWLHVKNYHGCHVIVEGSGEIPASVVGIAAEIAAWHSDGRGGDKIPVDYCRRKFVRKPPKAKPGQVFYTDFKTAYVTPREHAEIRKEEND